MANSAQSPAKQDKKKRTARNDSRTLSAANKKVQPKLTEEQRQAEILRLENNKRLKELGMDPKAFYATKWTEETVTSKLIAMIEILKEDEATGEQNSENPVRANTVKLVKEVCICVGVSGVTFAEWQEKFCRKTKVVNNEDGKTTESNPFYSPQVSELIGLIKDICECRLQYSGQRMDEFILKNHYDMVDRIDHTSKGEQMASAGTVVTSPNVTIIENH